MSHSWIKLMSDLNRLLQLAGLKVSIIEETPIVSPSVANKNAPLFEGKRFTDYLKEAEEQQTIGTDRAAAIKALQMRMTKKGQPMVDTGTAAKTFDTLKASGVIKQDGTGMTMPALGDEEFDTAVGIKEDEKNDIDSEAKEFCIVTKEGKFIRETMPENDASEVTNDPNDAFLMSNKIAHFVCGLINAQKKCQYTLPVHVEKHPKFKKIDEKANFKTHPSRAVRAKNEWKEAK